MWLNKHKQVLLHGSGASRVQIPAVRWAVPNALYDKALISTQHRRKALQNDPQASRCEIIVGFETISEHAYAFTAWKKISWAMLQHL